MEREHVPEGSIHVVRSREVLGATVVNRRGEHLGTLEDIVFEVTTGRVAYAVLSFGGVVGKADKLFAIPWKALAWDRTRKEYVLDVARERLDTAPGFDPRAWPDLADRGWQIDIYTFYGYRPHWEERDEHRRAA